MLKAKKKRTSDWPEEGAVHLKIFPPSKEKYRAVQEREFGISLLASSPFIQKSINFKINL